MLYFLWTTENDEGEEKVVKFPAQYEICGTCDGKGAHSLRFGAITQDEFYGPDWDEESRDDYMSGRYDAPCEDCKDGKVLVPNEDVCSSMPEWKDYQEYLEQERYYAAESAAERRMGC